MSIGSQPFTAPQPVVVPPTTPAPSPAASPAPTPSASTTLRWPTPYRFSVAQYHEMIRSEILTENDRVELIRGEIVNKMTIGESHNAAVIRLTNLFARRFGERALVSAQGPIIAAESEPEPDVTLLSPRDDCYEGQKPQAADTLLVIEVADTSLEFDRTIKQSLYAQAGIGEYWIVNLRDGCLEVYRQPQATGMYASMQMLQRGEHVQPIAFGEIQLAVAEILPQAKPEVTE